MGDDAYSQFRSEKKIPNGALFSLANNKMATSDRAVFSP